MSILLTAFFTQTFTDITVQPVSINTTLNSTVIFTCEAIADVITFEVNDKQDNDKEVVRKGFKASTSGGSNGARIGRLQAIAYYFNNNTIIQCRASTDDDDSQTLVLSNTSLLLIQGSEYLFLSIGFYLISFLRFIS